MWRRLFVLLAVALVGGAAARAQDNPTDKPSLDDQLKTEQIRQARLANEATQLTNGINRRNLVVNALPASPTTGAITVKDNAGQAEAYALAAVAVKPLAMEIAQAASDATSNPPAASTDDAFSYNCEKVPTLKSAMVPALKQPTPEHQPATPHGDARPSKSHVPLLLISGTDVLTFAHWEQFRFRACKIGADYASTVEDLRKAARDARAASRHPGGSLAGAATGLSAAVKVAELLTPDWEVANLTANVSNRLLLLEVAKAYRASAGENRLYWQSLITPRTGAATVAHALEDLRRLDAEANAALPLLDPYIAEGEARLKDPIPPEGLAGKVEKWKNLKAAVADVITGHAALLKDLYGGDAASPLPFPLVAAEAGTEHLLGDNGLVLSVNVENSGGTSISRKAIWNVFELTSPPLYVSGTVVVSYAIIRPADQQVIDSGSFACSTGAVRLNRVREVVASAAPMSCDAAAHNPRTRFQAKAAVASGVRTYHDKP
jgi:hypothetical protein